MENQKVISLEDRVPKLKEKRKRKANRQLILFIMIFFTLILLIIYLQTPLSKVKVIKVEGAVNITEETIAKLSGITTNTNFWKVEKEEVRANLKKHKLIKDVQIEKKIPYTVIIKIQEFKRVAYVFKNSSYYPILENGDLLPKQSQLIYPDAPLLMEWDDSELIQDMALQLKQLPSGITNAISEIHHTPVKTDDEQITVYMNDGFEVIATIHTFAQKMKSYPNIISQLDRNVKGIIHLEVGSYFEAYNKEEMEKRDEEIQKNEQAEN
ncbi:cell division protein FtsQ/DivIB [Aeribacillus alveayuensis]|uniref:Cell division protein DivIB n=1 Tax=Aeribacillus alveayuensis TaxID=279215 RepID=A0ABT9VLJ6_9BACI|nr:cell division protein FtsQ [Bacillus alveayuensis]